MGEDSPQLTRASKMAMRVKTEDLRNFISKKNPLCLTEFKGGKDTIINEVEELTVKIQVELIRRRPQPHRADLIGTLVVNPRLNEIL